MIYTDNHNPNDYNATPDNEGGFWDIGWHKEDWLTWLRVCAKYGEEGLQRWADYWNDQSWYDYNYNFDFFDPDFYNEVKKYYPDLDSSVGAGTRIIVNAAETVEKTAEVPGKVIDSVNNILDAVSGTTKSLSWLLPVALAGAGIIILINLNKYSSIK